MVRRTMFSTDRSAAESDLPVQYLHIALAEKHLKPLGHANTNDSCRT